MAHPILMPKPGQMTEECVLVAWHKREGDEVKRGEILFEIETDKSNMDVEAFEDGVLLKRYVEEGQTVPVNAVCAYIGALGETVPDEPPSALALDREAEPEPNEVAPAAATPAPARRASARAAGATAPAPAAPEAVGGVSDALPRAERSSSGDRERLLISPRASQLAAASGVDPRTIAGSGPDGRITERDVRAALEAAVAPAAAPSSTAATSPAQRAPEAPSAGGYEWGTDEEPPRPMSRMRRVIAERLTQSATTIPHFTVTVAADMTRLVELRRELKAAGSTYSVTDFILAATAQTLVEFPDVNSRTDGMSVWRRRRVHLGVAVTVPNGLVVAVIRDADRRSLPELHDRAVELAERARSGSLPVDDMTGSTFTVSNLGMFGVDEFSAIINPGEAAILAVSSVIPTPVVIGDGLGIRQIMKLTLSADHRLVDGELGARFLNALRRRLQDADAFRSETLSA
jgi:pyruvate dehydrogenase E2 component (dihydrolipoamide acetyltransferase)